MKDTLYYEVGSVEDYLLVIHGLPYGEHGYYFRGENKRYASQNSSLLRSLFSRLLRDNPQYYVDAVNDYIHDMVDQAGVWEQKHVLAWCHQEGQPTNLLELTASTLNALFYACLVRSDESLQPSQEVYVYGYAKENTVDVTPLILDNTKMSSTRYNLLEDMSDDPRWTSLLRDTVPKGLSLPDLLQFPYLVYKVPPRYGDSNEPDSLYFYQLFQLNATPGSELPHDIIQQQYTPSLIVKVTQPDRIRQQLYLRSDHTRI